MGEFAHGLFAVPSLVDKETLLISSARNTPLLIEGPKAEESAGEDAAAGGVEVRNSWSSLTSDSVLELGPKQEPYHFATIRTGTVILL